MSGLSRREFLKSAACAAAGVAVVSLGGTVVKAAGAAPAKAAIPQRVLGRTGVKVGMLGLGGDGIVSDSTDLEEVARLLTEALDAGVNFFDTAFVYGKDGLCEKNLGLLTGTDRRKEIFLATKTGARTYDTAMRQVETSLQRLRTDRLDLVQVHHLTARDDVKQLGARDGVLAAFRKLRDQKVVTFVGLTGHPDSPAVKQALEMYDWDTTMLFVNPARFSRPALEEQLPAATKKKMGILAMKVFGGRPGKLVGSEKGQVDARSLLRYAWSQPITVALAGIASHKQLLENIEAARTFKLMTAAEMQALSARVDSADKPWTR